MGKIFDYDGVPVLHTTSGDLKGYFYDGVYIYKGNSVCIRRPFPDAGSVQMGWREGCDKLRLCMPASEPRYTERRAYGSAPLLAAG